MEELSEHAGVLVLVADRDGTIVHAGPEALPLTGCGVDELRSRNVNEVLSTGDGTGETIAQRILDGRGGTCPGLLSPQSGAPIPVTIHASFPCACGLPEGSCILVAVAGCHAGADRPIGDGSSYKAIFDAANDAIFLHDVETGRIVDVNRKMCSLYGMTRDEACNASVADISLGEPPYSQTEALELIRNATEEGHPPFEWRCRRKNGELFWVEVSLRRTTIGGRERVLALVRDIDERKSLEEQFRQSQKMEAVGTLAGGVAHDFNNLLTAILGYVNVGIEEMDSNDPFRHSMEMIGEAANKAASLTRQLLAFSRKQVLAVKVLCLNGVVEGMKKMILPVLGDGITLELDLAGDLGNVAVDRNRIEQALLNLVLNAADAMNGSGALTIATSNVDIGKSSRRTRSDLEPGPYVLLEVRDTGPGIDRETGMHIFEPFFTTKPKGKGTGLGLSTAYGTVKQHRGGISFESPPGGGTTFLIHLPRVERAADPSSSPAQEGDRSRMIGTETVLIVEDEDLVRKVAKKIMEMHGYNVHVAAGPKEAIAFSEEYGETIDLLLTDVVMPGMDGLELYDTLAPTRREMRVLYMSGHADKTIIDQETLDPELHFLQKPFTVESLAARVRAVLDRPVRSPDE